MLKKDIMFRVGLNCQNYRRVHTAYTQDKVAKELGCSIENVSAFENARNDNYVTLLWYLKHGMTLEQVLEGVNGNI